MSRFCSMIFGFAFLILFATGRTCLAIPYAYIPNTVDSTLSVVTTSSELIDETVDGLGGKPSGVAVGYYGEYVFVTNVDDSTVSVIKVDYIGSTDSDEDPVIETIGVGGGPLGVAAAPDGDYVYVSNYDDGTVSVIETDDDDIDLVSEMDLGERFNPLGIAVTNDGDVYVADNNGSRIQMFNTSTSTEISVGENPYGVAVGSAGKNVYATNFGSDTLSVIRTDDYDGDDGDYDNQVVATIEVGSGPCGVAVAAGGMYVCVANSLDNSVSIVSVDGSADVPDLTLERTVGLDAAPFGIAAPLNGDYAYVTYAAADKVSRVDLADGTKTDLDADQFNGPSGFGRFIGGTPPEDAPDSLLAEATSDSTIYLTWQNNAYDVLGFKIERRGTSDEDTAFEQIAMVVEDEVYDEDEGEFFYTDSGLSDDTSYTYRISAYNEAADSDYSTTAYATTDEEESDIACFIGSSGNTWPQSGVLSLIIFSAGFCVCMAFWDFFTRKKPSGSQ